MARLHLAGLGFVAALLVAFAAPAGAQSLDPKAPTPLVAGENRGTVDSMVGPQYWSFHYQKGQGKISVDFASMGLFGNPMTTTIQVVLHAGDGRVIQTRSLTSSGPVAELDMPGSFGFPGTAILELRANGSSLVRVGGDYSITLTGEAMDFAAAGPTGGPERIVGTYAVTICPSDFDCGNNTVAIHFSANGTVQTTDGHSGTWEVFDPDAMIYSVVVGQDRWSLKLEFPDEGCSTRTTSRWRCSSQSDRVGRIARSFGRRRLRRYRRRIRAAHGLRWCARSFRHSRDGRGVGLAHG